MQILPRQDNSEFKNVSRETKERLEIYSALLQQWNKKINLVSSQDINQLWQRHICDSLQLVDCLGSNVKTLADFGSGGGFPGMVLALATNIKVTLVEADLRKSVFLREVLRQTQTTATVICQRIEAIDSLKVDVITARALASVDKLLSFAEDKLNEKGYCLFLKGRKVYGEIEEAKKIWRFDYDVIPSQSSAEGTILKINQFEHVE